MHSPDQLIPTAQVAEIHDVDVATVNRWAKAGRLTPAAKAPGRKGANLFRRSDVDALLTERTAAA